MSEQDGGDKLRIIGIIRAVKGYKWAA